MKGSQTRLDVNNEHTHWNEHVIHPKTTTVKEKHGNETEENIIPQRMAISYADFSCKKSFKPGILD